MKKKNQPGIIDIPEVDVPEPDLIIERDDISSPVLRRIIKEVEEEKRGAIPGDPANVRNYNRIHNRHNRGR